jgi:putative hydrolase of the HAD superfamily
MSQPKVIFWDAVGTLFGIRGSVGQIYSCFAAQHGVIVEPGALNRAFMQSFWAAPRAAFSVVSPRDLAVKELAWWQAIAAHSFAQTGVLEQFKDFDAFFAELFAHFATAEPWSVYEDVPAMLQHCRESGISLGVLSNFDSRLLRVLAALELSQFFDSVTCSTTVGSAKPEPEIFAIALGKHDCPPEQAWHIGDSWQEDIRGALNAGVKPIWLNRPAQPLPEQERGVVSILSLPELSAYLV